MSICAIGTSTNLFSKNPQKMAIGNARKKFAKGLQGTYKAALASSVAMFFGASVLYLEGMAGSRDFCVLTLPSFVYWIWHKP